MDGCSGAIEQRPEEAMHLKLIIAYDGSSFRGWQSQSHENTIQDLLEKAFFQIVHRRLVIHGAGRTDAGVHALAQCAHVNVGEVSKKMSDPVRWQKAINGSLPPSIRIIKIQKINTSFHARFSAKSKIYRYVIWHDEVLPPFLHERAWHLHGALDISILEKLSAAIIGTHDFRGFTARSRAEEKKTIRTIYSAEVTQRGKEIRLTFHGNGFLYHMVRMLVGSMVRVAQGRDSQKDFLERLKAAKPPIMPNTAPADGLYLVKINYPKNGDRS
ncbi:MAG: tRNA pseudouridine(38-40) synthase TruA [Chthoniobacterales bacterium]